MTTVETLIARQRALRAEIAARMDGTPNLRDYGPAKWDAYEADLTAYHAETTRLHQEMEAVARLRHTLIARQWAGDEGAA